MFRLIGFCADDTRREFIIVDAFVKTKQKLTAAEKARIAQAAKAKDGKLWKKIYTPEYPRLAR